MSFPEGPACFAGQPRHLGLTMHRVVTLRHFAETTHSWKVETQSASDGRAIVMNKKAKFDDLVCNVTYSFAVATYRADEIMVKHCVLKGSGGVLEFLSSLEAMNYLSKPWRSKLCTIVGCTQQAHRVEDVH